MNPSSTLVRRATVDDLAALISLWRGMNYDALELEKHLTDFQVIPALDGSLAGAIALQFSGQQGRVHSEAFSDFTFADGMRQQFWERLQIVAVNHGLTRLWTVESAPFWRHIGFNVPHEDDWQKLPEAWRPLAPDWLTFRLKAEEVFGAPVEAEFLAAREADRARTERALRRTALLNQYATAVGVILALLIMTALAYIWSHRHQLPPAP